MKELADRLGVSGAQVVKYLMTNGVMATMTQTIDFDTAALAADHFGFEAASEDAVAAATAVAVTRWPPPSTAPRSRRPVIGTSRRPATVVATLAFHVEPHTGARTTMAWSWAKVCAVTRRPTWYSHSPPASGTARPWPLSADSASTLPSSSLSDVAMGMPPIRVREKYIAGVP